MSQPQCLSRVRVLVVEDEPETRELVALVLRQHGAVVHEATDGASALEAFLEDAFDLVVSDLALPGVDGWSFVEELRGRGVTTRALALSASSTPEDTRRALAAGFDAHLAKPVGSDDLLEAVLCLVDPRVVPAYAAV